MKRLILLMVLAHVGDMVTTAHALHLGCGEINPLFEYIGYYGLCGVKAVGITGIAVLAVYQNRRDLLYLGISAGAFLTVWNTMMFPFCGRL